MTKTVLVAGASGLVGYGAIKHFGVQPNTKVIAVSRRVPEDLWHAKHVKLDLMDAEDCRAQAFRFNEVTHLVYAALHELPGLVEGWQNEEQIRINDQMLRNLLEPLIEAAPDLRHVTLLQGTKAYGVHVRPMRVPAREGRSEMREQPNFYWAQEDYLRARQAGQAWHWTILRPVLIIGEAIGGAMNLIPALGVFAAMVQNQGDTLPFPGGGPRISQAVDADLLARAIAWAGEAETARNETFNVTNGDVFVWEHIWPAIAEACGMKPGPATPFPLNVLAEGGSMPWNALRRVHGLKAPALADFVGQSFEYADYQLRYGHPEPGPASIVSTVKINQAGFHETMDTEFMFRKWFKVFQDRGLLPKVK